MTQERRAQIEADCEVAIKADKLLPYRVDFYSPGSAGLMISAYKGRMRKADNNRETRVDQVMAVFTPCANVVREDKTVLRIGHFSTDHPHAVVNLLQRMFDKQDIVDHEEFERLIVPVSERLRIEQQRNLETRNQLAEYIAGKEADQKELADLRQKLAALSATGGKTQPTQAAK